MITKEKRRQYREEGYFILEKVMPDRHLEILRQACDHLLDLMHQEMDRLGTEHIHISHRGKRYHIAKKYDQVAGLSEVVFSPLMAEICRATLGCNAYLFYEQYVVKAAEHGMAFSWHQDSGYLGFSHRPYVSCWCAVDDITPENGTPYFLPYSTVGIRSLVEHIRDPITGDKAGYFGPAEGVPALVPAGSVVVFSSLTFHRSGPNTSSKMRRAYMTQYSSEIICRPGDTQPMHLAVPFLKDGVQLLPA